MFGAKVQIAALEKGLDFDLIMVAYDSHLGYSPKHPEVLRINPKGQVPVLVHGGLEIFDSTQIFEYLEDLRPAPALWPRDIVDRAHARRLEHQSDEVYFPHIIRLMGLQKKSRRCPCSIEHRRGHCLLRCNGKAADHKTVACRRLFIRRHLLLHGQSFW
jgi:glutathione S-transferase